VAVVRPPWWTIADESELAVLVHALVGAGMTHRNCSKCRELNRWCDPMRDAADAVFAWLEFRRLRSKAVWLRKREEAAV
jgi:hypothetical protein